MNLSTTFNIYDFHRLWDRFSENYFKEESNEIRSCLFLYRFRFVPHRSSPSRNHLFHGLLHLTGN